MRLLPSFLILCAVIAGSADSAGAAEFQFGIQVPKGEDPLQYGATTAFLWVPPAAPRIRAVLLCPANVIERRFAEDPLIRAQAAADGLAIVFLQRGWKDDYNDSPGLVPAVADLLSKLAVKSGYDELATVPWIPVGHSGNTRFVGGIVRGAPQRTLAALFIKGNLFHYLAANEKAVPAQAPAAMAVPALSITGEFEEVMPPGNVRDGWYTAQIKRLALLHQTAPEARMACLVDRSQTHMTWFPDMSRFAALFIHQVVTARLGADGSLRDLPFAAGWLVDSQGKTPPAPVAAYTGDKATAGWFPDETLARAWAVEMARDQGKKDQMLAFTEDGTATGAIIPWWSGWALQGTEFKPLADGVSFSLGATFRSAVPAPFADAGTPLGHGDPAQIRYEIVGWASNMAQTGPNTFKIRFDREGINGRTTHVVVAAVHPGDATYRATVATIRFTVPGTLTEGTKQTLTFPALGDVPVRTATIPLGATATGGLPPDYYVSWGPAEVAGDHLTLTPIPVRAKLPIEVKVTAYQWGRASAPKVASAPPVTRNFQLTP